MPDHQKDDEIVLFEELQPSDQPQGPMEKQLDPLELLGFAKITLFFIFILFVVSGACYVFMENNKAAKDIFDTCKQVLPPLITLILGAYFSSKK